MQTNAITLVTPQLPAVRKALVSISPRVQHPTVAPRFGNTGQKTGLFAAIGNWLGAIKARVTSWVNSKASAPQNTIAIIEEQSAELKADRKNVIEASIEAATNYAIHLQTLQEMEKKQAELDDKAVKEFEALEMVKKEIAEGKRQVEESILKEAEAAVEERAFAANLHLEQLNAQRKITADSKVLKETVEKMERDYEKYLRQNLAEAEHAKIMVKTMDIQEKMREMAERQAAWQTSTSTSAATAASKLKNTIEEVKKRKIASDIRTEKALGKLEAGTGTADQKAAQELLKTEAPASAIDLLKARQKGKDKTKEAGKSSGTSASATPAPSLPTVGEGGDKKDSVPVVED